MKRIVLGILAHVDAGKTTLSEGILYTANAIRKLGRVDNGDAFLDTFDMEKKRGITIFSKQAQFELPLTGVTLIDTPGHADFSAEMERTLGVLDYALLVISGVEGIQAHTYTLWKLLKDNNIPTFIFVNKMDRNGADKEGILTSLKEKFGDGIVDFSIEDENFFDAIAMTDEMAMDEFLENEKVSSNIIIDLIKNRKVMPCLFGSALKNTGVSELLEVIDRYTVEDEDSGEFSGRIYKVFRDENGVRQSFIKINSGILKVKDVINGEKVNRIRVYNGKNFSAVNEATKGMVCALDGPVNLMAGQNVGTFNDNYVPVIEPVLRYSVVLPEGVDAIKAFPQFLALGEELPELSVEWNEEHQNINLRLMGEIQLEIIKGLVKERMGYNIEFDSGNIVYKETITNKVEGVGHYEPLKHYAEVHLILEPLEAGSGLVFETDCSEDVLDTNWQRLILTHLKEKNHPGVLLGAGITDMKISLVNGRAHTKHTEGGDFRQATYRAVRQGLMCADSMILEPVYDFELEIPTECVGRAMTDIKRMYGDFEVGASTEEYSIITGRAPVSEMMDYHSEVLAYSKGMGSLRCTFGGYEPCHNPEEVMAKYPYDPLADLDNPCGSVFCSHGAGFNVPWDEVPEYMHLESALFASKEEDVVVPVKRVFSEEDYALGVEEVDDIIRKAGGANTNSKKSDWKYSIGREYTPAVHYVGTSKKGPEYILLDGYNVIYAWDELKALADTNMDSARDKLLDIMCNYQAVKKAEVIVVFDAYRVKGHREEYLDYHNIHVVYTAQAETADRFIEKFAHDNGRKYNVTVVTSDGQEQIIVMGQGCNIFSSREFEKEVARLHKTNMEKYNVAPKAKSGTLMGEIIEKKVDISSVKCDNSND